MKMGFISIAVISLSMLAIASAGTFGGNAYGAPCVFPFVYRGKFYYKCTFAAHNRLWCATTHNYDHSKRWGNCKYTHHTFGGNAYGAPCVFPFIYRGVTYHKCISARHHRRWCSATSNYDHNKKWGNCPASYYRR